MTGIEYPVSVVRDLEYACPGGVPLRVDLHVPAGAGSRVPVVVWIHGGGWRFGNRRVAPDLSRFFACRGFAMAAIDYRSSAHALFPAQVEDVKTAIAWLRREAPVYGFDPVRIGLLGASAGGHLAALAALAPPEAFTPPEGRGHSTRSNLVQAVVAGYAPSDFLQMDAHRPPDGTPSEDPETLRLPRGVTRAADPRSFESLLLGAPIESCPGRVRDANPLAYAAAGAPPFLVLHGSSDMTVPLHQSELLYEALAAHDNDVTLAVVDGLGHGFLNRTHLDDGPPRRMVVRRHARGGREEESHRVQPVFPMIEAFFRAHLAPAAADADSRAASGAEPA